MLSTKWNGRRTWEALRCGDVQHGTVKTDSRNQRQRVERIELQKKKHVGVAAQGSLAGPGYAGRNPNRILLAPIIESEASMLRTQSGQGYFRNAMLCTYPPNPALMLRNAPSVDTKTVAQSDQ